MTLQEALDLGAQLHAAGRLPEAENVYRQILAHDPRQSDAMHLLGVLALQSGQPKHAEALIRQSISINPRVPAYHSNLCAVLTELGRFDPAIESAYAAIKLNFDFPDAWINLGQALEKKGTLDEAIAAFRRALDLQPTHPKATHNLKLVLDKIGSDTDREVAALQKATSRNPRDSLSLNKLGVILMEDAQIDLSVQAYRRGIAADPANPVIASNLLFSLHYHPDVDSAAILDAARQWNIQHAKPLSRTRRPHTNDRSPDRPLRIGYVGSDFYYHCQTLFLLPLFTHHNRKSVEVFCYSSTLKPDEYTDRLKAKSDTWRDIAKLKDDAIAGMIREDRIDILVDLTQHMIGNRLTLFARKPAPIQVSWLAYPGTTGVETIDYRLTDPHLDPPGQYDAEYSETSIRLPDTYWCFDPAALRLPKDHSVHPAPSLTTGHVTFGCFNNPCKINPPLLETWSRILTALPDSRLLLLAPRSSFRPRVLQIFSQHGVSPDRIEFADRQPRWQYLTQYQRIDIALDTFPYNGHTTTLETLWMGVPLITQSGPTVVSRAGLSQLQNLNLPDLVADTALRYAELAINLAADPARLTELRAGLRPRMESSPLMNSPRFATNLESAYRQMWRRWIAT